MTIDTEITRCCDDAQSGHQNHIVSTSGNRPSTAMPSRYYYILQCRVAYLSVVMAVVMAWLGSKHAFQTLNRARAYLRIKSEKLVDGSLCMHTYWVAAATKSLSQPCPSLLQPIHRQYRHGHLHHLGHVAVPVVVAAVDHQPRRRLTVLSLAAV